jgi:hypothetical protein
MTELTGAEVIVMSADDNEFISAGAFTGKTGHYVANFSGGVAEGNSAGDFEIIERGGMGFESGVD